MTWFVSATCRCGHHVWFSEFQAVYPAHTHAHIHYTYIINICIVLVGTVAPYIANAVLSSKAYNLYVSMLHVVVAPSVNFYMLCCREFCVHVCLRLCRLLGQSSNFQLQHAIWHSALMIRCGALIYLIQQIKKKKTNFPQI